MPNAPGDVGFLFARPDAAFHLGDLRASERLLAASVRPALLGQRNAFALALADQRALEFRKSAHHRQHEVRHRGVVAGEGQVFLEELNAHAARGQALHHTA